MRSLITAWLATKVMKCRFFLGGNIKYTHMYIYIYTHTAVIRNLTNDHVPLHQSYNIPDILTNTFDGRLAASLPLPRLCHLKLVAVFHGLPDVFQLARLETRQGSWLLLQFYKFRGSFNGRYKEISLT